jgi:formylglycine-generating enzyme required for sulfatase activity
VLRSRLSLSLSLSLSLAGVQLGVAGETFKDCPECPPLLVIAAGSFTMGTADSEAGREPDEGPQRVVTLATDFALGAFEVTRQQFAAFTQAAGYRVEPGCFYIDPQARRWVDDAKLSWRNPGFFQDDDHPVTCVSFADAQAYVAWLTDRTGRGYRLPTEAEWEYAVRGGTQSSRFWGDSPGDSCRFANAVDETARATFPGWQYAPCEDGYIYTSPVGRFAANPLGLFDMPGNLWEWVADCWVETHHGAPDDGGARADGNCERRVIRGGAWDDEHEDLRSGNRLAVPAARRYNTIGIRVVGEL